MKVKNAEFIISAVGPEQYPQDELPEIALVGRSNVGKSSLINTLIHRKNLARTSSHPGKTQTLNYYKINEIFYFVDLPGYGYAKVSKTQRARWGKMIEKYLLEREDLIFVMQVIDIRHSPTDNDRAMYDWLKFHGIPVVVVATKLDKIAKGKIQKHLKEIEHTLQIKEHDPLVAFSAENGRGKEEIWKMIDERLDMFYHDPEA